MPRMPRLKRVKRLTSLERLPDLSGKSKREKKRKFELPALPNLEDRASDWQEETAREYGDSQLAGRMWKLKQEMPAATKPELVVYDWLRWRNIPFDYQVALFGGWGRAGGQVPDFILKGQYSGRVLQVQGNYWHKTAQKRSKDEAARIKMKGTIWQGQRIEQVTFIWEDDLKNKATRTQVMDLALGGIEMPGR